MTVRPTSIAAFAAVMLAAWPCRAPSAAEAITADGREVRVLDGDTVEIAGRRLQLYGIDTTELGQICLNNGSPWTCGLSAAFNLKKLIGVERASLRCNRWGKVESGTITAVCKSGEVDVGLRLIETGQAVAVAGAFPEYSVAEEQARKSGLGIWRGAFVRPAEWRAGSRLKQETTPPPQAACAVKGTTDADGERALYFPTDKDYGSVTVNLEQGGRCFASDEEAIASGWTD